MGKEPSSIDLENFMYEYVLAHILMNVEGSDMMLREMTSDFLQPNQMVTSHLAYIKQHETQLDQI